MSLDRSSNNSSTSSTSAGFITDFLQQSNLPDKNDSKHGTTKRKRTTKTGLIGVDTLSSGRFQAKIWLDRKWKYLGSFDTKKEAAKTHDNEAIKQCLPFSKLNYPKEAPVGYLPMQQVLPINNTVGYRGAYRSGKSFRAKIRLYTDGAKRGVSTNIGSYETAKEAAIAYDRAVLKNNQSTTLLNFPGMIHNLDVEPRRKKHKGRAKKK